MVCTNLLNFASSNQVGSLKISSLKPVSHGSESCKPLKSTFKTKFFATEKIKKKLFDKFTVLNYRKKLIINYIITQQLLFMT